MSKPSRFLRAVEAARKARESLYQPEPQRAPPVIARELLPRFSPTFVKENPMANTLVKPIAVVEVGTLTADSKAALEAGGYIVVESDRADPIKILSGLAFPVIANDLLGCAVRAIIQSDHATKKLGEEIAALLVARTKS